MNAIGAAAIKPLIVMRNASGPSGQRTARVSFVAGGPSVRQKPTNTPTTYAVKSSRIGLTVMQNSEC